MSEHAATPARRQATARARRLLGHASATLWRRAAAVTATFALWELASRIADNRLLPGPVSVIARLVDLTVGGQLAFHGQLTLQRGALGLAIAVVLGLVLGIALGRSRVVEATLEPFLAATYPIPKLALYPLMIVALGFGGASKVAMVALECSYPIAMTVHAGVRAIDPRYFWLLRNVEGGRRHAIALVLRAATPAVFASLRVALPISLVIMTVTELIGESRGLGFLIRSAGTNFRPADALAVILALGIIGFVLDRALVLLGDRLAFWARRATL